MEYAILVINETVIDITGKVQTVCAHDKLTGELKYRGNGIVAYGYSFVDGNVTLFLKHSGFTTVFGKKCRVYTLAENWNSRSYAMYDMIPSDASKLCYINKHFPKLVA